MQPFKLCRRDGCQNTVKRRSSHFCSYACSNRARVEGLTRSLDATTPCAHCGHAFRSPAPVATYCSTACMYNARRANRDTRATRSCLTCTQQFRWKSPSTHRGKLQGVFCSRSCTMRYLHLTKGTKDYLFIHLWTPAMHDLARDILNVEDALMGKADHDFDLDAALRRMAGRAVKLAEVSDLVIGDYLSAEYPTPIQREKVKVALAAGHLSHNAIRMAREVDNATLTRTLPDGTTDTVTLPAAMFQQMQETMARLETESAETKRMVRQLTMGPVVDGIARRDFDTNNENRVKSQGH